MRALPGRGGGGAQHGQHIINFPPGDSLFVPRQNTTHAGPDVAHPVDAQGPPSANTNRRAQLTGGAVSAPQKTLEFGGKKGGWGKVGNEVGMRSGSKGNHVHRNQATGPVTDVSEDAGAGGRAEMVGGGDLGEVECGCHFTLPDAMRKLVCL